VKKTKFGVKEFSAKIDEMRNWFKDYKITTRELWIQGAVKEGVQKLFVTFEAMYSPVLRNACH
jgi:hypothetical protein